MKNIKKGILIILILFNIFFPAVSFATGEPVTNSPVTLTTGLPFFPKDCRDIADTNRKKDLCYENTAAYNSKGLIKEVFEGVFRFIIGSAGTLCVIMLIVSGLQMAFAAGNAEVLGKSRDRMKNSVIGLILTVSSGFILSIINPQLLNFDFKEPSKFVISGFNELQGKPGAKCMLSFPAGATNIQNGKVEIGCNYGLYCYVPKIEEGNVIGQCKKYIEPGGYCGDSNVGELCQKGYDCVSLGGPYTCQASSQIKGLAENDNCITGNLNCDEGLFCFPITSPSSLIGIEGRCTSCHLLYNQLAQSKSTFQTGVCFDANSGFCNTNEVAEKGLCEYDKELGAACVYPGECSSFNCAHSGKCEERSCKNNNDCDVDEFCNSDICKEKECDRNSDCEDDEFCNNTGKDINGNDDLNLKYKCEDKRSPDQYCRAWYSWCLGSCNALESKCY